VGTGPFPSFALTASHQCHTSGRVAARLHTPDDTVAATFGLVIVAQEQIQLEFGRPLPLNRSTAESSAALCALNC